MDKDRFRELLQSFEQLSVKPEAGAETDIDSDAAGIEIPDQHSRRVLSIPRETAPPVQSDIEIFMNAVQDNGILFSELELTRTLPDIDAFKPNTASSLTERSSDATVEMSVQQQLNTASRFRFVAGMLAQLWSQADGMSRDRTAGKETRTSLAKMKSDLVTLCAASLAEAGQMETQTSVGKTQNDFGQTPNEDRRHKDPVGLSESLKSDEKSIQKPVEEITLGGRILQFASSWPAVTADPCVLQTVTEGLRLDFAGNPEHVGNTEAKYTLDDRAAIERVIRWDLGDKVIEEIPYRPELFVSHIYTLRIAGKLKALVEFRTLNKYLAARSIKVNEGPSLKSLIRTGDWVTRINIKCAYPSVPIHADHRRYLVFKYDDRYYQYRALPFGISIASRAFTKLLQAALQPLRDEGFRITSHIDDICLMNSSYDELVIQTTRLSRHLLDLGFLINSSTSNLKPLQSQRFLGFEFNTLESMFYFPRDQIKKVRRAVHTARSTPITAKQLAALLGKVRSIMPAVGPDAAQICELEKCLDDFIISPDAWDENVPLSPYALDEINWLCDNILSLRSMPFSNSY